MSGAAEAAVSTFPFLFLDFSFPLSLFLCIFLFPSLFPGTSVFHSFSFSLLLSFCSFYIYLGHSSFILFSLSVLESLSVSASVFFSPNSNSNSTSFFLRLVSCFFYLLSPAILFSLSPTLSVSFSLFLYLSMIFFYLSPYLMVCFAVVFLFFLFIIVYIQRTNRMIYK